MFALLAACDESNAPTRGTGGANGSGTGGASAGTGGVTTEPGTGGSTTTPPASDAGSGACGIPCLATIDSECVPSGACTEQATGPLGVASNRCYDNGVKILSDVMLGLPASTIKITHRKPGGAVCFTVEGTLTGTTSAQVTWKDPSGTAVATGTYNLTNMQAVIMCGGQSFDAQAALGCGATRNLPRAPGAGPSSGCTAGTCAP